MFLSNGEASGDFQATLDVDSNGKVHIALTSGTTLLSGPLKYFNNVSGSFQEIPTGVSVNISYPRIRVDINNNVHIIYRASSTLYYINNVTGTFTSPVSITPPGQLPAGIQSLEIDDQNRLYTSYQSSQSASGKGFYLLFAENGVFNDTILIADLPPEYVTRNSSQVVTKGNGDIAMFYAEGDVRNDTVICDIFMKRGNIYQVIPVEMASFNANVYGNHVKLSWMTITEKNNYGFDIERMQSRTEGQYKWQKIGFVEGSGTTTEPQNYWFEDDNISHGNYSYRLKQIDLDGSSSYSKIIEVDIATLNTFSLEQNYPNPFNPSTVIGYRLPVNSDVTLKVFDLLGREVATLVDEFKPAGKYEVEFNGKDLSSGIYFYTIQAGSFTKTEKMILLK
jgi:hypothetical protein